ncbi:hypothetical protein ACS0TY_025879 [Phlomoides rotata]
MVTAVASTPKQRPILKRPPLLPSDSDNAPPRRPRAREVTSRYLSLSTSSSSSNSSSSSSVTSGSSNSSRKFQSPMLSTRTAVTTPKSQQRPVSAERRRPTPSNADRMLVKSVRSLSVSFQGESYSFPVSKVKAPPANVGTPGLARKGTPERRKAGVTPVRDRREKDRENSRPIDQQQHRWPARLRSENSSLLSRSLDYGTDKVKWTGSGSALKELRKSMVDENSRNKVGGELKLENNETGTRLRGSLDSDVESVSSESTAIDNTIQLRLQKVPDPSSPLSHNASSRTIGPSKLSVGRKFQNDSPVSSPREVYPSRGFSPLRGGARAASPGGVRGINSPSRARIGNSVTDSNTCSTPFLVGFPIDLRRVKLGDNRIADAHDLRIQYNRLLQWRLANAKAEHTLLVQKRAAERSLYNAWVSTAKLRHSVRSKGIELQLLRHNLNLYSILKKQEPHLESWDLLDRDHCNSVSGAIKALEASTLRLPIAGGARADVHEVQEAICSAVDVMQAMASSICSSLPKVEQMNAVASELSNLSAREHHLLDECKDFLLSTFIPLQVMHCSLRTHVMQVQRSTTSFAKNA